MNTYEPAFVGLAHLMPDWKRWGFPNEQAYLSAGSPKTQYAQWQKAQQAAPPPPAFPSTAERMGLTHPLPTYPSPEGPPNAGQATASHELAEYGAPPAPKPDLSALYNPVAAAQGTSAVVSPPQQFAGTFMQPNVTAPAGTLRAQLQQQRQGASDYTGVLTGLQRINEATAIPGVTPFLRNTVAPAVGDVFAAPGELTGIQPLEDVGRFLGESIVPTTGLELGLEAIPGVGFGPDIARGARRLGGEATEAGLRRYATSGTPEVVRAFDQEAVPPVGPRVAPQEGAQPPLPGVGVAEGAVPPEGFAGNIRLSKYPEAVREPIKAWADANPQAVQTARRGVRSDEQVLADAESLVNDLGGNFDKLQKSWRPGQAWNAEEVTAIRGALTDATRNVMQAADAARAAPGSIAEQNNLAAAILEQQRIQGVVHGVTAEAGRALRAFRQQSAEALASGDVRKMQDVLRRAMGKEATPERMQELATLIRGLDVNDPAAVNNFIRSVNKPNFWDKLHFYWMNSILSGWVTQGRNIFGNIGATAYSPVKRGAASLIEQPLAAVQGRQAQRFWQEAPASVAGAFQGLPEGVRGAIETLKTGISPRAAEKLDVRPAPIGGVSGRVLGAPTTVLGAMDEFFSAINYRSSLRANAVRQARTERLSGTALSDRIAELVNDPPPNLVDRATSEAEELVFRGDPGEVARRAAALRSSVPGGRYWLPFLNTPANLLKYGIKNSPLGLLDIPAWRKAIAGNPEGVDELTGAFLGSAVAASLASMVATGQLDITAAAPINAAERDRFFREGKRPFSVNIPGIGWVEYKQLPMLDTTFTLVASVKDGIDRGENVEAIASQAAINIGTALLDKSYMSSIGDLFDAIQDPARYAERYATRHLGGYVPFSGFARQTAQAIDPTVRQPEGPVENIKASIPGLTGQVPERLTFFGEPAGRPLTTGFVPTVSADRQTAVDQELEALDTEIGPTGKSIAAIPLTRSQQAAFQRGAGQLTYQMLDAIIQSPSYQGLSDGDKIKVIERARDAARSAYSEPISKLKASEGWAQLTPEQQKQVIDAVLVRSPQELLQLMGR